MHEGVGIKNPLFFIGVVENNIDPRREGRCQVRAFGVHGTNQDIPTDELPWAIVVQGDYNPNNVPRLNAWIFGVFLDGRDAQQPMILGLIPTQHLDAINPGTQGWGVIPREDADVVAQGTRPQDIGQPLNSRLARGEDVQETYVMQQEMGRIMGVRVGGDEESTWDEPGSAYDAQYPHNRVIETGAHVLELDDTPGSERIMIWHKAGSYIQIDTNGTVAEKAVGDKYEVYDRKHHVFVKGMSTVTIDGHAHVYVKGNKTEEIQGDYRQIVHGNYMLDVGQQLNINGANQTQIRGADLRMGANVGTLSISSGKEIQFQSGQGTYFKSEKVWIEATDTMNIKALDLNMQATGEMNILGEGLYITGTSDANLYGTAKLQVGSGGLLSVYAPNVAIDDYVSMANGEAEDASAAGEAEGSIDAVVPEMPEPTAASTSVVPIRSQGSWGSSGYSATDHSNGGGGSDDTGGGSGSNGRTLADVSAVTQNSLTPLLDFIGNIESSGYDDYFGTIRTLGLDPPKRLTEMTIGEVLAWQEQIDENVGSEAAGRYQIVEDTLRGYDNGDGRNRRNPPQGWSESQSLYARAGLSTGSKFDPANQDKMAIVLIEGRGLNRWLRGDMTTTAFANNLANEWAALPIVSGPNAGLSQYEGDGLNSSRATPGAFLAVLRQVQSNYNAANSVNSGGPGFRGES